MHRLLFEPNIEGYPADFLLARIRGRRRGALEVGGRMRRESLEPWAILRAELYWLFNTMNRTMRREFGFCFLYFELRRLLTALRRLSGRSREGMTQLAVQSLLNRELLRQLQNADDVIDAVRLLDITLQQETPQLETLLVEQGHRRMEGRLLELFFAAATAQTKKKALRGYFRDLIDLHNLLSILKGRRWKLPEPATILSGGTLTPEQWHQSLRVGHEPQLYKAISRISGVEGFDAESVESALLSRIGQKLHRQARSEPGSFLVLDYLWLRYLQTRNLGLQRWAGDQLAAWERLG